MFISALDFFSNLPNSMQAGCLFYAVVECEYQQLLRLPEGHKKLLLGIYVDLVTTAAHTWQIGLRIGL